MSDLDTVTTLIKRISHGWHGPLTEREWNAAQRIKERVDQFNLRLGKRVRLSPYLCALLGLEHGDGE